MTYRLRRGTMPALPRPEARYSSVGVVHAGHGITAGHRPRDRAGGAAGALGDASEGAGNLLAFRSPTPPPVTPGSTANARLRRDQGG